MLAPVVHNSSGKESDWVKSLPEVGLIDNRWRRRMVALYADPEDPSMLYMYGVRFDFKEVVITREKIGLDEKVAMDYWKHGKKVLVRG